MEKRDKILIPVKDPLPNGEDTLTVAGQIKNAEKLTEVGLTPIFVSADMSRWRQYRQYRKASGILIPGGADIHPSFYKEKPLPTTTRMDKKFDEMEIRLTKKALKDKKPILGICRGAQLLAVATGGSLFQHIPDITTEKHGVSIDKHDDVYPSSIFHDIIVKPGTKAHTIFKAGRLYVPSRHHQAIKAPGKLVISGVSPEGIVEIIEHPTLPFTIGMQIHAELVDDLDPLYTAFASAVKQYQAKR